MAELADEKKVPPFVQSEVKDTDNVSGDVPEQYSLKEQRQIRRKIDFRIIPALGLMYGISLMDRKNTSVSLPSSTCAALDVRHLTIRTRMLQSPAC